MNLRMVRFVPYAILRFSRFYSNPAIPSAASASILKKPKRFYKHVNIYKIGDNEAQLENKNEFGIVLDGRKLRSPFGHILHVSEPLALLISQEWKSQSEEIRMETMHLTGLAFTALDNPHIETKDSLINNFLEFLETDTLLYFAERRSSLYEEQCKYWSPIIQWANHSFGLSLRPVDSVVGRPIVMPSCRTSLERHLQCYNFASLIGFNYATEAVKSMLITLATLEHYLDVETAVRLARLEQIYQTKIWGSVEWAHEMDHLEQCARLSAAVLFIHHNSFLENK